MLDGVLRHRLILERPIISHKPYNRDIVLDKVFQDLVNSIVRLRRDQDSALWFAFQYLEYNLCNDSGLSRAGRPLNN